MESQTPTHTQVPTDKKELISAINQLKKEKNAVILAHFYQEGDIQDVADFVADSLGLAQYGATVKADIIVLAGVIFMAETAKILSPEKKVLAMDLDAGCSLADNCPADKFQEFIERHKDHKVVTYVNCSAEVKALSDILCTSSNAVKIINSFAPDQPLIFAPDQHLGKYLIKKTGRDLKLWQGSCIVHETFDAKKLVKLKARHPEAILLAHPECTEVVLDLADHIGSTSALLKFSIESSNKEFIVVTEAGIIHQMKKASPDKIFIPASNSEACNCAECPFMRLNTLEKLFLTLSKEGPEINIPEEVRTKALIPLQKMLALS